MIPGGASLDGDEEQAELSGVDMLTKCVASVLESCIRATGDALRVVLMLCNCLSSKT